LSGWVVRKSLSWFTSQLDWFCVPPYRPADDPDTTLAPLLLVALDEAGGPELAVAGGGALVGDAV
jgi:hypothetical protein